MQTFLPQTPGPSPEKPVNSLDATLLVERCVLCHTPEHSAVCSDCMSALTPHKQYCHGCAIPLTDTQLNFCGQCLSEPFSFDRTYALYTYTPVLAELIHRFKYTKNLSIGKLFAQELSTYLEQHQLSYDLIIPMPLHPKRQKKRGFNQSIELTRYMPKVNTTVAKRIKHTTELNNLSPKERSTEIKGAFHVKHLTAERILLVDDVLTTASSMNELAKTIRRTYKQHTQPQPLIEVLVLARAVLGN